MLIQGLVHPVQQAINLYQKGLNQKINYFSTVFQVFSKTLLLPTGRQGGIGQKSPSASGGPRTVGSRSGPRTVGGDCLEPPSESVPDMSKLKPAQETDPKPGLKPSGTPKSPGASDKPRTVGERSGPRTVGSVCPGPPSQSAPSRPSAKPVREPSPESDVVISDTESESDGGSSSDGDGGAALTPKKLGSNPRCAGKIPFWFPLVVYSKTCMHLESIV